MSGYLSGLLAAYFLNLIIAYAVFMPGVAGIINLGAAGFVAIGAYTSAYLNAEYGMPLTFSILSAMCVTFVISLVIAAPILRTRGVYMVLATIAFGEVVIGVLINIEAIGGAAGYPVSGFVGLSTIILCAIGVIAFTVYLMSTRFGLTMRAIHDDEPVASLFGIEVRTAKVFAFSIGSAIAGLGGALFAHHYSYVDVAYFTTSLSIYTLLYVLIGGTQTAFGPIIGAASVFAHSRDFPGRRQVALCDFCADHHRHHGGSPGRHADPVDGPAAETPAHQKHARGRAMSAGSLLEIRNLSKNFGPVSKSSPTSASRSTRLSASR